MHSARRTPRMPHGTFLTDSLGPPSRSLPSSFIVFHVFAWTESSYLFSHRQRISPCCPSRRCPIVSCAERIPCPYLALRLASATYNVRLHTQYVVHRAVRLIAVVVSVGLIGRATLSSREAAMPVTSSRALQQPARPGTRAGQTVRQGRLNGKTAGKPIAILFFTKDSMGGARSFAPGKAWVL